MANLEFLAQLAFRKVPADEDEATFAALIRFSGALRAAFDQHMHALNDEALVVVLHGDDALHAKDIESERLGDILNPGNEPLGVERPVGAERQTGDLLIVFMSVRLGEKSRLDLEDPVEIERIPAEHRAEIDAAAFGAMQARIRIDATNGLSSRWGAATGSQMSAINNVML